jgi:cbb3-type cytochrome oxidase maturation protein
MESLYLLIPLSLVLVLGIGAVLVWSVLGGQFEDLEAEGNRILADDTAAAPAMAAAVSDTAETSGADRPPGSGRD